MLYNGDEQTKGAWDLVRLSAKMCPVVNSALKCEGYGRSDRELLLLGALIQTYW